MKRVLIGKVGQKVFFNRNSEEVKRSNTNGNVGLYKLMKLMFDNMPNVEFWLASQNDGVSGFSNVVDASSCDFLDVAGYEFDAFILVAGLAEYESDWRFIDIVNDACNHCKKTVLISEDPRCTESLSKSDRFYNFSPDVILDQHDGYVRFKDKIFNVTYSPIELAACYEEKIKDPLDFSKSGVVVVANRTGSGYDRTGKIISALSGVSFPYELYGRLSQDEKERAAGLNYLGEVAYDKIEEALDRALITYCVPIEYDWVTSKYVEALIHGVLPVFHTDYAVELLSADFDLFMFANTSKELEDRYREISSNTRRVHFASLVRTLQRKLIEPYVDGKRLAEFIRLEAGLND